MVLWYIRSLHGIVGIPLVKWYGTEGDYNVMVIDLLGKSLEDCFDFCNRHFSLKTVLMIAEQLLSRIEIIHSKCYIHRDIKPDNFLIGSGSRRNLVYVIDFGLSKLYRDPRTHRHIPYIEGKRYSKWSCIYILCKNCEKIYRLKAWKALLYMYGLVVLILII